MEHLTIYKQIPWYNTEKDIADGWLRGGYPVIDGYAEIDTLTSNQRRVCAEEFVRVYAKNCCVVIFDQFTI